VAHDASVHYRKGKGKVQFLLYYGKGKSEKTEEGKTDSCVCGSRLRRGRGIGALKHLNQKKGRKKRRDLPKNPTKEEKNQILQISIGREKEKGRKETHHSYLHKDKQRGASEHDTYCCPSKTKKRERNRPISPHRREGEKFITVFRVLKPWFKKKSGGDHTGPSFTKGKEEEREGPPYNSACTSGRTRNAINANKEVQGKGDNSYRQ